MSLKRRLDKLDTYQRPVTFEVWQVDADTPDTYTGPEGQTLTESEFYHYKKAVPPAVTLFVVRQTIIERRPTVQDIRRQVG